MKQNYYIESYEELNNDLISLLQSDLNELDRYCFQDLNFLKYYVNLNNFKKKN